MDITEVARRSGVPPSTLRFYEAKKLIASFGRHGLRRQFDPAILQRLALITLGRDAGFSLDEIAGMLGPDGRPRIDRRALTAKAKTLDKTIRRLTVIRDGLEHAAACTAPSYMECPTFRRLLDAVARRAKGTKDEGQMAQTRLISSRGGTRREHRAATARSARAGSGAP